MAEEGVSDRSANAPRLEAGALEGVGDLENRGRGLKLHRLGGAGSGSRSGRWRIAASGSSVKMASDCNLGHEVTIFESSLFGPVTAPIWGRHFERIGVDPREVASRRTLQSRCSRLLRDRIGRPHSDRRIRAQDQGPPTSRPDAVRRAPFDDRTDRASRTLRMLRFRGDGPGSYRHRDPGLFVRLGLSLASRARRLDGLLRLPRSDQGGRGVRLALLRALGTGQRASALSFARIAHGSRRRRTRLRAPA